jgi:hypothetical protein
MQGLHVQLGDVYCVFLCKYSMRITEVVSIKPPTPEQARIKAMQAQVRQAQQRVKAERVRQQQARLNQQRSKLAGM